jgi:hypothetical protein
MVLSRLKESRDSPKRRRAETCRNPPKAAANEHAVSHQDEHQVKTPNGTACSLAGFWPKPIFQMSPARSLNDFSVDWKDHYRSDEDAFVFTPIENLAASFAMLEDPQS